MEQKTISVKQCAGHEKGIRERQLQITRIFLLFGIAIFLIGDFFSKGASVLLILGLLYSYTEHTNRLKELGDILNG